MALLGRHDGRVVAVAGYDGLREPGVAEVAFAVADDDQRRGLRLVGPSSLGVLNTAAEVSLNARFSGARVRAGALAIGSPSGAVGIGLLGHAAARQLGVSMFASLGNRADVSTNDLLNASHPPPAAVAATGHPRPPEHRGRAVRSFAVLIIPCG